MGLFEITLSPTLEAKLAELVDANIASARAGAELATLQARVVRRQLREDDAVTATFSLIQEGPEMPITSLSLHVGETKHVKITPKKAAGQPDPTVENVVSTINGSATGSGFTGLAPYGDGSDPLKLTLTGLSADPGDEPHISDVLSVAFDSATEPGETQNVVVMLPLRVIAENATTAEIEEIEAPPAPPEPPPAP